MNLRRSILFGSLLAVALGFNHAVAQYPTKPIRLVVPFAPGGGTDSLARTIGQELAESLGQPVVIDNRPGAGGTVGSAYVARSPADGYTLIMGTNATHAISAGLYAKLPYDPVRDFTAVGLVATSPSVLVVNPELPVESVEQLIAYARARPRQINFSSAGNGSSAHLAAELFKSKARIDMVHVPYKGGAPAVMALLAGEVSVLFAGPLESIPHVRAGKLRALAVTTSEPSPAVPDLPTVAAAGLPGYELTQWFGIFAPAGTPEEYVERLNKELVRIVAKPEVREHLAAQGLDAVSSTPDNFGAYVVSEVAKMREVVKASGARVE